MIGASAMVANYARSLVSIVAFAFAIVGVNQRGWTQPAAALSPEPIPVGTLTAYSREFAQRFALDTPAKDLELAAPLQALEFRVERSRWRADLNECLLSIYIDSRLPLYFPNAGPSGMQSISLGQNHFFTHASKGRDHWLKLSLDDRRHLGDIQRPFNRNAAFSTADYNAPDRRGSFFDVGYREFQRELFPGVHYIQLDIGCHVPRWFGSRPSTLLWLKRQGGKDYSRIANFDPNEFERLELPRVFVERMSAFAKEAARSSNAPPSARPSADLSR